MTTRSNQVTAKLGTFITLCVHLLLAAPFSAPAQQIQSIDTSGFLTWDTEIGATSSVEWASSPHGPWYQDWSNLASVVSTTNPVTVPIPRFFRIRHEINLDSGLVAYYPLNGDTLDASGNGHHGTATGVAYTPDGAVNGAYSFNGTTSLIRVPHHPDILSSPFTVVTWIRTSTVGSIRGPISKAISFSPEVFRFLLLNNGDVQFSFHVQDDTSGSIQTPFALYLGNWTMLTAIYTGTKTKMYLNDQFVAELNFSKGSPSSTADLLIGAGAFDTDGETPVQRFIGDIDEVRIYNRPLLPAEISALYNFANP